MKKSLQIISNLGWQFKMNKLEKGWQGDNFLFF